MWLSIVQQPQVIASYSLSSNPNQWIVHQSPHELNTQPPTLCLYGVLIFCCRCYIVRCQWSYQNIMAYVFNNAAPKHPYHLPGLFLFQCCLSSPLLTGMSLCNMGFNAQACLLPGYRQENLIIEHIVKSSPLLNPSSALGTCMTLSNLLYFSKPRFVFL